LGIFTPITAVYAIGIWSGTCSTLTLSASVSGPPTTLYSADVSEDENGQDSSPNVDVCDLSGGSDMPGTVVHFEARLDEGSTATSELTLGDKGPGVVAGLNSNPESGARVEPGQTIGLKAIGMLLAPAQGIERLRLLAQGQEIGTAGNASGSTEPIPCDPGRFFAELDGEYTVPDPAPPVIEICAVATTFDGYEREDCAQFFTGQAWTGTMQLNLFKDYLAEQSGLPAQTCADAWDVRITFTVGEDDALSGTASARLTGGPECTFEIPGNARRAEFAVSGRAFPDRFELTFAPTSIDPPGDFAGLQGALAVPLTITRIGTDRAEGQISIATTEAGPFPVQGEGTVALSCPVCSAA
jgi:hypothetical protein